MKRSLLVGFCMLLALSASAQETAREVFQQAESRFQSGDYEVALQRYEALVRDFPFSEYVPDAQFRRAVVLYRLERYDDALSVLRRVEARYRSTRFLPLVPFWKGVTFYRRGNYPQAQQELERFLDGSSQDELRRQAWLYHALTMLARQREGPAVESLENLFAEVDVAEDESYGLSLLLSLYIREEDYESAVELYDRIDADVVDEQWRTNVQLYGAEALRAVGRRDEALDLFLELTEAGPAISGTAFRRAYELAQELDRSETAREIVQDAEQALSGRSEVLKDLWMQVGMQSYNSGREETAELYLSRVWNLEEGTVPDTVPLYLAEIHTNQGRTNEAIEVLEEAVSQGLGEFGDRVLLRLANLYLDEEDAQAAGEALDQAVTEYPDSDFRDEGEYLRAFALYRLGADEEALAQVRETLDSGRAGDYEENLLWLKSLLHRRLGERDEAIQSLRDYLAVADEDVDARLELAKLLFEEGRFDEVITRVQDVLGTHEDLATEQPGVYVQVRYIEALSHVALKEYQSAIAAFEELPGSPGDYEGLQDESELLVMYSYSLFYQGWANYRLSRYEEAEQFFAALIDYESEHEFAPRAAYLAGWSAFNRSAHEDAAEFLRRAVSLAEDEQVELEATLLLGRSLKATEQYNDADTQFRNVFADSPDSELADDALFEYAESLERRGRLEEAVSQYRVLFERYPESGLSEEGMYRRGEVLFQSQEYSEARQAFFEYRANFPEGDLIGPALYWGGVSAFEVGEASGALLLWEELIEEHRQSSFRADAMQRAAEVHRDRGDYRRALNLYSRLISTYPRQAEAVNAEERIDELLLRIGGLSEREAELWVRIEQNRRTKTEEGRRAVLEAARIAIRDGGGDIERENLIVPLLKSTAEKEDEDPQAASEAYFLLGEYYVRQSEPTEARDAFLNAAATYPEDSGLTAQALYRATEASILAGGEAEARSILEQLEENFPNSEWTEEARELVEEEA
ncbi:MAG: tetratricopeptide repeat protein [Spirochaetia bacterium]